MNDCDGRVDKKIIDLMVELTTLRVENKNLKERVKNLEQMNSYLNNKIKW